MKIKHGRISLFCHIFCLYNFASTENNPAVELCAPLKMNNFATAINTYNPPFTQVGLKNPLLYFRLAAIRVMTWRLGNRSRSSFCAHLSRIAQTAGVRCLKNSNARPRRGGLMRKRFFYYAFGSSRKEQSDGTAIVRQRRNRVNDIIINEKKLTGDCRSAFYYLNLISS